MRAVSMTGRSHQVIYADSAATTRLSATAYEAMRPFLLEEYGNPSQPYGLSRAPRRVLREARETVAACIGADPDEGVFTSGGTESDNWAIKGFALSDVRPKVLVASAIEHHAVLRSCEAMKRLGHRVDLLPVDTHGRIVGDSIDELRAVAGSSLVSCMFANNEIGTIQPVTKLCDRAHAAGALFHTDAVQAVGHVPIDVHALGVDFLSASGHKFNGPRGTGFLYIRKGLSLVPYLDGGAQEAARRAGTENVAGIVGMAAALKENCADMAANADRLKGLEQGLLDDLRHAGLEFRRNGANQLPGLLSLSFPGVSGEILLHRLDLMGVCISTGSACDGVKTQVSHVLRAIGLDDRLARGTIRVSLGKDTTEDDVHTIASCLIKVIEGRMR